MNVALCISGIPRGVYSTELVKSLANNKNYNIYIFIYYWEDGDLAREHSYTGKQNYIFDEFEYAIQDCYLETQADKFQNYLIEFQKQYDTIPAENKVRKETGIYGMYYSVFKVGQMWQKFEVENNIKFDCVIRSRFESRLKNQEEPLVIEQFDLKCIWIPDVNYCKDTGINDQVAFSNRDNMRHYMNVYNNVTEFAQKYFYGPELILHKHLLGYKVHKQRFIC